MKRELPSDSASAPVSPGVKPLDWPRFAGKAGPVARAIEAYARRRRRNRQMTAVAGVAVLVVAGMLWREMRPAATSVPPAASAVVSLPERQTLPDGSLVELKPGATIDVEFGAVSSSARRVLLTAGEAHFTVTTDPLRPFVVEAGGVAVRAVGTAFSVQVGEGGVEVLVTEGTVAVGSGEAPARVEAGQRAVVQPGASGAVARVEPVSASDVQDRLAWRVPRLEFNATPLADVVAMFNRHATAQPGGATTTLVLADDELASLPLSGMLRADNVSVLLQIIESSYRITAERRAGGEIVLQKAQ